MGVIAHDGVLYGGKTPTTDPEVLVKDTVGWTGKNLLQGSATAVSTIINDITFTVTRNDNGEITEIDADGTANANANFIVKGSFNITESIILSGCNGGSASTYKLQLWDATASKGYNNFDGDLLIDDATGHNSLIQIVIYSGQTVSHIKFYPMIRKANIKDSTFEVYHDSVNTILQNTNTENLIRNTVGWTGKNLIPYPYNMNDKTTEGITFIDNNNGSITVNGTTVNPCTLWLTRRSGINGNKLLLSAGKYNISGGISNEVSIEVGYTKDNAYFLIGRDVGNGLTFELTGDIYIQISLKVENTTVSNITFYPMLYNASIINNTYEPYHESVDMIKANRDEVKDVIGWSGKNLLKINNTSQTLGGITYTVNSDGSVKANGTAAGVSNFILAEYVLPEGDYIASKGYSSTPSTHCGLVVEGYNGSTWVKILASSYSIDEQSFSVDYVGYDRIRVTLKIDQNDVVSNLMIYPMIRKASIADDTYEPYHKSVKTYVDSIFDEEIDNEAYTIRNGKGTLANIKKLIGGTLAWNQKIKTLDANTFTFFRSTGSFANGVATYTAITQGGGVFQSNSRLSVILNHKYLVSFDVYSATATDKIQIYFQRDGYPYVVKYSQSKTGWQNVASIANADENASMVYVGCVDTRASDWTEVKFNNPMVIDLTQMFGSTIADAIYTMEQANAGAGVTWFRNLFPNTYYAYNAGSLQSVEIDSRKVIDNIWNGEWEIGYYSTSTGDKAGASAIRNVNYIKVEPHAVYFGRICGFLINNLFAYFYDKDKNYLGQFNISNKEFVTPSDAYYMNFNTDGIVLSYTGIISIGRIYTYNFNEILLRGIPKLVDNALQYDGDIYTSDGNIIRKYGIVNLGDLTWELVNGNRFLADNQLPGALFPTRPDNKSNSLCARYNWVNGNTLYQQDIKGYSYYHEGTGHDKLFVKDTSYVDAAAFKTAMSGVYLVYELATPIIEMANSYQNPQRAFINGTEEFIDAGSSRDMIIPVGHETKYDKNVTYPDIEDYIDNITDNKMSYADNGVLGAKNLLPYPYKNTTKTSNGITFTVNNDSSIKIGNSSASQTATAEIYFDIMLSSVLSAGSYRFSFGANLPDGVATIIDAKNEQGLWVKTLYNSTRNGDNGIFIVDYSGYTQVSISIRVLNNTTIATPVTIYPMVRLASDPDTTYAPYAMTNRELTELATVKESAVTDIIEGAVVVNDLGNHLLKFGKVVYLTLSLNRVNVATQWSDVVFMIPEGYRPKYAHQMRTTLPSDLRLQINSNGKVLTDKTLTDAGLFLSTSWITN